MRTPAETFAKLINSKLALSRQKEVLIYVHGYKVVFDNPILVTTELWHFLGYDGVAIAFAWPQCVAVSDEANLARLERLKAHQVLAINRGESDEALRASRLRLAALALGEIEQVLGHLGILVPNRM